MNQSVRVRTRIGSQWWRGDLTSRIAKSASGRENDDTAGLSGGLLIGNEFLVAAVNQILPFER